MSVAYSGHYPIERRVGEIERLHVQSAAMAPDTREMLARIGRITRAVRVPGPGPCGIPAEGNRLLRGGVGIIQIAAGQSFAA